MPIAATTQSVAAVVSPRTDNPWRMIAPAPRKPIPVTICAAIRVGSARTTFPPLTRNSRKPYAEAIVNSAEPTETSMCVRKPAYRSRSSRSRPAAQPSAAADDPERDRPDRVDQDAPEPRTVERACRRDVGARDRRAPRPAVGLEDVAVEPEGPFPERLHVCHGAERAPDQPLDLDGAAFLLPGAGLTSRALAGRRGQHRVLGREPAAPGVAQPARDALVERGGTENPGLPLRPEHRAHRLLEGVDHDLDRAQRIGTAPFSHATASRSARVTCSMSPSGSCRKRSPSSRKSAGSPVVRKR